MSVRLPCELYVLTSRRRSPLNEVQETSAASDSHAASIERDRPAADAPPTSSPLKVPAIQLRDLTTPELDLSAYQLDGGLVILTTTPETSTPDLKAQANAGTAADTREAIADDNVMAVKEHAASDFGLASKDSIRLANMRISQQLRSMSQLSESHHDERLTPEIWTLHHRERPEGRGLPSRESTSTRSHHRRGSSSGVNSTKVPDAWGRVQQSRAERDTSSSVYSRGVSTDVPGPYELPGDFGNWPLADALSQTLPQGDGQHSAGSSCRSKEPLRTPSPVQRDATVATLAVPTSLPTTHSTVSLRSNVSNGSKATRFTERFTPPKKTVKKRRSFFKFLRANSRRQVRSISTPILRSSAPKPTVDGTNEENDTLTVQYELDQQPPPTSGRSVSLNNLISPEHNKPSSIGASSEMERKMSLADYERHLSMNGDDRRRSSSHITRLSEIHEAGPPIRSPLRKSLSQKSKHRDSDSLMQSALEHHVKEKALMRSPSKRSVAVTAGSAPSFAATVWDEPGTNLPSNLGKNPLNIHEPPQTTSSRRESDTHLSPHHTPVEGRSRKSSLSQEPQSDPKTPIIPQTPVSATKASFSSKAGSPLASWSRYPSHTRNERCGSAGPSDKVIARDFAVDITPDDVGASEDSDPFQPGKKTFTGFSSAKSSKHHFPKSRSATFGTIARYYANIFSNPDFHLKGRRTSLATSGQLKDPELEILPPALPPSSQSQPIIGHESHRGSRLSHIKHHFNNGANKLVDRYSPGHHHRVFTDPATQPIAPVQFRQHGIFHEIAEKQANEPSKASESHGSGAIQSSTSISLRSDKDEPVSPKSIDHRELRLDGTAEEPTPRLSPSKAEILSEAYQECVVRPTSHDEQYPIPHDSEADAKAMPPPPLKPIKRSSPEHKHEQDHLDPNATVRRFPSVTVVDDRKGHWRSVSFISVKSDKSFVRESSRDLLKAMEEQKVQEREKLLLSLGAA